MPFPIFTLQDVDPRFNETAISNNAEVMQQAQQIKDDKKKYKEQTNRRLASGLSSAGAVIGLIPTPFTRILGTLMGFPDLIYDGIDFYNQPDATNGMHLALDMTNVGKFAPPYTKFLKSKPSTYTDILKNVGVQLPGFIDDSYNATTGRDIIEDLNNFTIKTNKPKQNKIKLTNNPNRISIKDTKQNNLTETIRKQIKYFPFYNNKKL